MYSSCKTSDFRPAARRVRLLVALPLALMAPVLSAGCGNGDSQGDADPTQAAAGSAAPVSQGAATAMESVTPSFDCAAADGAIEELICTTPELATLDVRLDSVWQEVTRQLASGSWPESEQEIIRAEQRGWIGGRNECWKADDPGACAADQYVQRIITLQAGFGLVPVEAPTFWSCEGNAANEFVLSFVATDPQSVRVERGDRQEVMIQTPTASGARYLGTFGKEVWVQGGEGTFVWPQEDTLRCVLAPGR